MQQIPNCNQLYKSEFSKFLKPNVSINSYTDLIFFILITNNKVTPKSAATPIESGRK